MAKALSLVPVDREYRGLLRTFSKMNDIAKNDMKQIAQALAARGAAYARGAAASTPYNPRQAIALATTIKISMSDKAPSFSIGGKNKIGSSPFSAGYAIMGNELGATQNAERKRKSGTYIGYKQFPKRSPRLGRGNKGWWLFPAMTRFQPIIAQEWLKGYERIRDAWKGSL
jgi:hypothetical protein